MDNEIWKDIPGYENRYQVSTHGRIKSLSRTVRGVNHYTGNDFVRTIPERILKPGRFCKAGHLSVVLEHNGHGKPVHQLVLLTFVGKVPEGCEVLHNDGDPTNNRLDNLRYGTRTDNILDVYRQGKRWRKLSVDDVDAIRFGLCCGLRGCELAQMFHVSQDLISKIKNRKVYAWHK